MHSWLFDMRMAARTMRRHPRYSLAAAAVLAIGIGANAVVFSFVNNALLRPVPFLSPDELILLWSSRAPGVRSQRSSVSRGDFEDWADLNRTLEEVAAYGPWGLTLVEDGVPRQIPSLVVTPNLFSILGARPRQGRLLREEDARAAAMTPVVMSHEVWQRYYRSDPDMVGRILDLDDEPHEVVGILPPGFAFTDGEVGFWLALPEREESRRSRWLHVIGRLASGETAATARADLAGVAGRLAERHPESNRGWGVDAAPLAHVLAEDLRSPLWTLQALVALVLAVAAFNVTGLMLARMKARRQELAVRASLGAGRSRLARQILCEGLLLSAAGGLGGLVLAWISLPKVAGLLPADVTGRGFDSIGGRPFERLSAAELDLSLGLFLLLACGLTALIAGCVPGLRAARIDAFEVLRGRTSGSAHRAGARMSLVVAQVSAAVVLLVGAGVLAGTFFELIRTDPGIRVEGVLKADLSLGSLRDPRERALFGRRLIEELSGVTGIEEVSYATKVPFTGVDWKRGFLIEGGGQADPADMPSADYNTVGEGYFELLGIGLLEGRLFGPSDAGGAPVAIVNQAAVRRYWSGGSAEGTRIRLEGSPQPIEVVGVVADTGQSDLGLSAAPEIFVPFSQRPAYFMRVLARVRGNPDQVVPLLIRRLAEIDPRIPVENPQPLETLIARTVSDERFSAVLSGLFAALALSLAMAGIYGMVSFLASERRYEMGVRLALGADRGSVVWLITRRGLWLSLLGIAIGLAVAFGLIQVLESMRAEPVSAPWTLHLLAMLVVLAVALPASFIPARAAARLDVSRVLRAK